MKILPFFLITLCLIVFFGCTDPVSSTSPSMEINLAIKPKIANQTILPGKYYLLSNLDSILVNRLNFYVSNLSVSNAMNQRENSTTIHLFSFGKSINTISLQSNSLPLTVDTFRFLTGLDDAVNNSDPTKYEESNPLSSSSNMYWTDWTKYRYIVFEGIIKSNGVEYPFIYHTGLQYKNASEIIQTKNLIKDTKNEWNLILNIDKIFYPISGNNILYKTGETVTHSNASESIFTSKFALNFSRAFTIE